MKSWLRIVTFVVSLLQLSCAGGTTTGNPLVQMAFAPFTAAHSMKVGTMAVTDLKMCFKRLRFKTETDSNTTDPMNDSDNIDLFLGEVSISSTGTDLGEVSVPKGTYTRVEFDLEKDCTSGYSLIMTKDTTTYQTEDRITIRFEGTFVVDENSETLEMGIEQIISALDTVTNSTQIKDQAESASGSF